MSPVRLVARREVTERSRERSFMISTGITLLIIVAVVVVPGLLGVGDPSTYTVRVTDDASRAVAERAVALADSFDAQVEIVADPDADVTLSGGEIHAEEEPDDELVNLLQVANQEFDPNARPPLRLVTAESADPERDAMAGVAFFAILVLYGQLLTYGFWVASGVVEEKSSRVIEVLLATIKPKDLLAGKILGLGLLGFGQLVMLSVFGLAVAGATGTVDIDGDLLVACALALGWFVLGYAFYAAAFAVAGALVPRQEELQSSTSPLTMVILVSFFVGFVVINDPDGTVAQVTAFIPTTAPITMPPRIILGEAAAWEIAASIGVMLAATALLIPLAARIYSAVVLRTGSTVKLSEALRLASKQ